MNNINQPGIICQHIRKTYGEGESKVVALDDVNLTIGKGELRLLMGPSGSGKTTLISIIAGLLTQDSGDCLVNGVNLNHLSEDDKTRFRGKNIGFVFQQFNLIPSISVEDNISIPLLLNGVPRKEALERAEQMLIDIDMGSKIGTHSNQLSGGQQQRVAIARGIIHRPEFIVCDEPTSFLDHHTGMMIMELLKDLVKKHHLTAIVVTHDPRIVEYADKIDHLEDGMITQ